MNRQWQKSGFQAGLILMLMTALLMAGTARGSDDSRIKDLAFVQGTTGERLLGYGLVVGLNGTGDGSGSEVTHNSISNTLEKLGTTVTPELLKSKNVAAVYVTARLDPNASAGSTIDVEVASFLNASSLEGGRLIMTPLQASDGTLCVLASGSISIGGFNIKSGAGNSFRKNHAQVGVIPNGGVVKVELPGSFVEAGSVTWLLHHADFTTSSEVAKAINKSFGQGTARAENANRIKVALPSSFADDPVGFIAQMGEIRARSDAPARVVLNERTGTIIVGRNVQLKEAAVAHGNLKVQVSTYYDVSQPRAFARRGETVVTPEVNTDVQDKTARVLRVPETSTVADVVGVLNDIGASPRDIIAILEALKRAGSLQAELVVM